MTDTPPKPKRRRWRWLVGIVLMLNVGGWILWPRGDGRFVGTWGLLSPGEDQPMLILALRRNGLAEFWEAGSDVAAAAKRWHVEGEQLVIGEVEDSGDLFSLVVALWNRVLGPRIALRHSTTYEILKVEHLEIVLRKQGRSDETRLLRQ